MSNARKYRVEHTSVAEDDRRRELIPRLRLHVLTDRDWSRGRSTLDVARQALQGGATVIQLRDKTASTHELVAQGIALRELTREFGALFIVNDRIDVALAVDADGAHVGQDDMPATLARRLLGPDRILGVSVASVKEAEAAYEAGADLLGVGPIYPTQAKADAGLVTGPGLLSEIARCVPLPLVAIGGITAENAGETIRAGATGIAVIREVVAAEDIMTATRVLIASMAGELPLS
jgi:thiamine-phosphate pyrophosphorylase